MKFVYFTMLLILIFGCKKETNENLILVYNQETGKEELLPRNHKKIQEMHEKEEYYSNLKNCLIFKNGEKSAQVNSLHGNVCFQKEEKAFYFACIDGNFHLLKIINAKCRDINKKPRVPGKINKRWGGFFYDKFDWPLNYIPHCKQKWRCSRGRWGLGE